MDEPVEVPESAPPEPTDTVGAPEAEAVPVSAVSAGESLEAAEQAEAPVPETAPEPEIPPASDATSEELLSTEPASPPLEVPASAPAESAPAASAQQVTSEPPPERHAPESPKPRNPERPSLDPKSGHAGQKRKVEAKLEKILALATKERKITCRAVVQHIYVSPATAGRYLNKLVVQGKLKRSGRGRAVVYSL